MVIMRLMVIVMLSGFSHGSKGVDEMVLVLVMVAEVVLMTVWLV